MKNVEYFIARVSERHFKIAKFEGGTEPSNAYFLVQRKPGEQGYTAAVKGAPEFHCDCPNRRRGKHINDKHGVMVAQWLLLGEPQGSFDEKGKFYHGPSADSDTSERADEQAGDDSPHDGEGYEEHS